MPLLRPPRWSVAASVPTLEHRDEWEWGPRYSALLTQPRARWTASCHFA